MRESSGRKRRVQKELWTCNQIKKIRQSGKPFVNRCDQQHEAQSIRRMHCVHGKKLESHFKCSELFDFQEEIHNSFWSLNDNDKIIVLARSTLRKSTVRKTTSLAGASRGKFSYSHLFYRNGKKLTVCLKLVSSDTRY